MKGRLPRVLILIDWFEPAFKAGGPIKSVRNIINQLNAKYHFTVICSSTDVGGEKLDVDCNELIVKENYDIIYLDKGLKAFSILKWYKKVQPDTVYFNSVFSVHFTLLPLLLLKFTGNSQFVIASRGMLGKGALQIKASKKNIFLSLGRYFLFNKELIWHASSEHEAEEIKLNIRPTSLIRIAQNLSNKPQIRKIPEDFKTENQLKLIFLSRISEKKNLLFLLQVMEEVKMKNCALDIYGPIEDEEYWLQCEKFMNDNPRVNYKGSVSPNEIDQVLQSYHLFVFPTRHENFGHVIAESINNGIPVLLSKGTTPWVNLSNYSVGFNLDLDDLASWSDKIDYFYKMNNQEYLTIIQSCFDYSKEFIVNESILLANEQLFLKNE